MNKCNFPHYNSFFTYNEVISKINKNIYGFSKFSQPLFYANLGNRGKKIILQANIHAREWITCFALLKLYYKMNKNKYLNNTYFFIFSSNPDGFRLATQGCNWLPNKQQKFLTTINAKRNNFSMWKANANGVDLNVNFDANWGKGINNKFSYGSENFVGFNPNSETETKSLIDFTKYINPNITISLHTKGEELYYWFGQKYKELERDYYIAEKLAKCINVKIMPQTYCINDLKILSDKYPNSTGGYKDWCIQHLQIPSFTIELGDEELQHPIGFDKLNNISKYFLNIDSVLEEI